MSTYIRFVNDRKYVYFSESKTVKAYDRIVQVKHEGKNVYKNCNSETEFRNFINSKNAANSSN
jgi:hypothetical protein